MFGKKKVVKEVPVVSTPEPQVAEELSESQAEEVKTEEEETETPVEEELTNLEIQAILQSLSSDIAKIKYHLRLDF
jgi:CO dehydrogenase/acetyl-CoA synthase beta subunit